MKYTFIAPIHFIKINTQLNRGIVLMNNLRISNNNNYITQLFRNTDLYEHIGSDGYKDLEDSTYVYAEGNLADLHKHYGQREQEIDYCFIFLREISSFLETLWEIEDHNCYIRDGFFYLHNSKNPKDGTNCKASLSTITSTCEGYHVESVFSRENILEAISSYQKYGYFSFEQVNDGGRYPLLNPLNKEISRVARAKAFVSIARSQSILPLKIFNYCTALECLFTTDNTEVSHKNAERVAALIGSNLEGRLEIYKTVKKAYSVRSKLTHGQSITNKEEELKTISKDIDLIIRRIYNSDLEVFSLSKQDLEEYFMKLILGDNS